MSKQELCNKFYDMNNVVTVRITMPQSDWEALRTAEPHGGTCRIVTLIPASGTTGLKLHR